MKTYDKQEELRDSDTEITLGMTSILGIFFGLALICGIFFGFGYSVGRSNTPKPALPAAATPQAGVVEPQSPNPTPSPITAAPPPITTVVEGASSDSSADSPTGKPSAESAAIVSQPSAPAAGAVVPALETQSVPANASAPIKATAAPLTNTEPAGIVVQIAAVSRPDDANALVAALRKLGYSASARSDQGDGLLHVQIGPFATRDQAQAMRARLLSDGYNAILK